MTQDQAYVPRTRSQLGLPPLNPEGETLSGANISQEVMKQLSDALGDSPIGTALRSGAILVRVYAFCSDGWK